MFTIDFQIIITYQTKQKHKRLKYNGLSSVFIKRNVQLRVALGLPTICQWPFVYSRPTHCFKISTFNFLTPFFFAYAKQS